MSQKSSAPYSTPVVITSNIIDRWAGLSQTFEVWGETPSARYVAQILSNVDDRARVAKFFIARDFALVFKDLVKLRTVKPSECVLSKNEIFSALTARLSVAQASVVMELVLPSLINLGIVSSSMRYSTHIRYGFAPVTADSVRDDVAVYQVMQAVKMTTKSAVGKDTKYTVATLGELLAEDFRKIGLEMYEINDLASIVGDMVNGVRAALDPDLSGGALSGSVSQDWKRHRVVDELSKNLVFVRAAMRIPPGSNVSLSCEDWKLQKWGPIILAALQSSERYAWVSKSESLRSLSLKKVRDTRGVVKTAVLSRAAEVTPIAQTVFALEDSLMPGAFNISATKDRIAEVIQVAYGSAKFNANNATALYAGVLSDAVESGWLSPSRVTEFDWTDSNVGSDDICCLLASRLYVELPDPSTAVTVKRGDEDAELDFEPSWRYVVATDEKNLDLTLYPDTEHRGNEVSTTSRDAVLLAHPEFDAQESVPTRPQVFGPSAFNTRLVNFDERVLHSNGARFAFNITVNGVNMRGSFKPANFASMRTSDITSVVVPHFNQAVITQTLATLELTGDLITKMEKSTSTAWLSAKPSDAFFKLLRRRVARFILETAQKLSPQFRAEVHNAIVDRTISGSVGLSVDESVVMRAQLNQRAYAACADVLALQFFLFIQGMEESRWFDLANNEEMLRVYLEMGTDRDLV